MTDAQKMRELADELAKGLGNTRTFSMKDWEIMENALRTASPAHESFDKSAEQVFPDLGPDWTPPNPAIEQMFNRQQRPHEAPEWLWFGEDATGKPIVTFGRWPKNGAKWRYKFAEIQPTEHDHSPPPLDPATIEACAKFDELELLINEYNPMMPDWNFRRGVILELIAAIPDPQFSNLSEVLANLGTAIAYAQAYVNGTGRSNS